MASTLQDVLLRVKEGADIVQIVGQYVPLKRAGSKYLGVCPFHNDRHPSMNVNPRMGIYKCFACGAGGDAIKFVQEFERVGFVEALRLVAAKAGIAIPEGLAFGDKEGSDKTAAVVQANQIALQVYVESLDKNPAMTEYLKERGLNRETVKHFQIGYAPESPDVILQRAQAKQVPTAAFVEAGILGESGGRVFDRFAGRLMFPIFNLSGRVIAFGGRIPPGKDGPKYINSPESPLYQKSRVLYGFNFARQAIDHSGEAVIVEGYMDLVSLWQAGVHNAVAVCGTALTQEHAKTLTRFARKVYLFFDGDVAGRNAVRRSLEPLLTQGVEIRVPVLPESEDPDSYMRKNSLETLQALFASAEDLPDFLMKGGMRSRGKTVETLSPEEKDAMLKEASEVLKHNPSVEVREEHLQNLRKRLGLRPAVTRAQPFRSVGNAGPSSGPGGSLAPTARVPGLFLPGATLSVRSEAVREWQLLQLLLSYPDLVRSAAEKMDLGWFSDERVRDLFDHALALLAEKGELSLREFRERVPDSLQEALASLEIAEGDPPDRIARLLADCAAAVESRYLRESLGTAAPEQHAGIKKRIQELNTKKP